MAPVELCLDQRPDLDAVDRDVADLAVDGDAVEDDPAEPGAGEVDLPELEAGGVGAVDGGVVEVDLREPRAREVDLLEARARQTALPQHERLAGPPSGVSVMSSSSGRSTTCGSGRPAARAEARWRRRAGRASRTRRPSPEAGRPAGRNIA